MLRRQGAEVRSAARAAEALEVIASWRPDVLVSDIAMPEQDGYALIAEVRKLPEPALSRIPAIAVTAHARIEDRERALSAGYDYHIAKPVDRLRLIEAVASAAGRRGELPKSPAQGTRP